MEVNIVYDILHIVYDMTNIVYVMIEIVYDIVYDVNGIGSHQLAIRGVEAAGCDGWCHFLGRAAP
jgi:hypothetical protein